MLVTPKVIVAQLGARKHYQEPIFFHQWGVLHTLYTDLYAGDSLPMRLLRHPHLNQSLPSAMKRLVDRYDPSLNGAKIIHFPLLGYNYVESLKRLKGQNQSLTFIEIGKLFCNHIIQRGLGDADTIYGFNSACLELFQYAKQRGLRCILDQTLAESFYYHQLMQAEEARWPHWSVSPFVQTDADYKLAERERQEQDLADHIICGSSFVKSSLIARGIQPEKITVVSLGRVKEDSQFSSRCSMLGETISPWKTRLEGLRILFAGSVGLRKGIPYLLKALKQIKGEIPFVCKTAGAIELNPEILQKYSDVCEFLGHVTRSDMSSLYKWADVFVLPSICEGSAMVTYEALHYGLPIITTYNSGSIIQNELGGWIVPSQDSDAIALNLVQMYLNTANLKPYDSFQFYVNLIERNALKDFMHVIYNSAQLN